MSGEKRSRWKRRLVGAVATVVGALVLYGSGERPNYHKERV